MEKLSLAVIIAQGVIIVGIIMFLVNNSPKVKYPLSGSFVSENFNFEFENADSIIIADNEEFKDAIVLNETSSIFLETGEYYWKAIKGVKESSVEKFFVEGKNISLSEFIAGEIGGENGR